MHSEYTNTTGNWSESNIGKQGCYNELNMDGNSINVLPAGKLT